MAEPRRNPKRKAQEQAQDRAEGIRMSENILPESLAPMTAQELDEWEGWQELESDPVFFNDILRNLGINDVKVQDVIDLDLLMVQGQAVHGLIFLFEYNPEDDEEDEGVDTKHVWFANQTTANACATVAILNTVMNIDGLNLGDHLGEFKSSTIELSTPLRGHVLANNSFIRARHNSVARRIDFLNSDLWIQGEEAEAASKKKKRRQEGTSRKKSAAARRRKKIDDANFHFVAYVPVDGYVWELDGLKTRPVRVCDTEDLQVVNGWTNAIAPFIRERMEKYEGQALSFNLLAVCRDILSDLSNQLAANVWKLEILSQGQNSRSHPPAVPPGALPPIISRNEPRLASWGVTPDAVAAASIIGARREDYDWNTLSNEQEGLVAKYYAELAVVTADQRKVAGRRKDFTPAIHAWIRKLAEKEMLELVADSASGS